jgi:hypothetical protein
MPGQLAAHGLSMTDEHDSTAALPKVGENTVPLALYARALDEIYALRRSMAYEAAIVAVHLDYKTFPKTRRRFAEEQVERMRQSARGRVRHSLAGTSYLSLDSASREAGIEPTLTRSQWEAEAK